MKPAWSFLLLATSVTLLAQGPLTPQEERGRQIYERGSSASGQPITASIGPGDRVSATILPCANCHGHDGQGRPEGGVVPSNITWDALTKPYGLTHPDGRTHPPYTERLLRRAIGMGMDPAGNQLNSAMPRFQLSLEDAADLVEYIKRLGQVVDPGLSATSVRLGVILPPRNAKIGQMMHQVLESYFARINAAGGIFSRQIELNFWELPAGSAGRGDAVRDFLNREKIFAVVCGVMDGAEAEIAAAARNSGTPMLGGMAAFPQVAAPLNPYVFYLDGGVQDELAMLVDFAAARFPALKGRARIVASDDAESQQAARWLAGRLGSTGDGKGGLAFWLRPEAPPSGADGQTVYLVPESLLSDAALAALKPGAQKLYVAESGSRSDGTRATWDRIEACAEIVGEGLKRAGRNLTRSSLIEALESFYRVETSLQVPISFAPTRRVGAKNVHMMQLDQEGKLVPVTP